MMFGLELMMSVVQVLCTELNAAGDRQMEERDSIRTEIGKRSFLIVLFCVWMKESWIWTLFGRWKRDSTTILVYFNSIPFAQRIHMAAGSILMVDGYPVPSLLFCWYTKPFYSMFPTPLCVLEPFTYHWPAWPFVHSNSNPFRDTDRCKKQTMDTTHKSQAVVRLLEKMGQYDFLEILSCSLKLIRCYFSAIK